MMRADEVYNSEEERGRLQVLLEARYLATLVIVHRLIQLAFARHLSPGLPALTGETVRRVRALVAARVALIDGTTLRSLQDTLDQSGFSGLDAREQVMRLYGQTWKGRAKLLAESESRHAANEIALDRYAATGVIDRLRLDESQATDYCKNRHNQVVPIESRPGLAHPSCRLKIYPVARGEVV